MHGGLMSIRLLLNTPQVKSSLVTRTEITRNTLLKISRSLRKSKARIFRGQAVLRQSHQAGMLLGRQMTLT